MYIGEAPAYIHGLYQFPRGVMDEVAAGLADELLATDCGFIEVDPDGYYIGSNVEAGREDWPLIREYLLEISEKRQPRVLFMRDMGAGDVMMSVPTVRQLKTEIPSAHITYATLPRNMAVLDGVSAIDEVISTHDIKLDSGCKYDLVVNWSRAVEWYGIKRNRLHRVDSFAEHVGVMLPNTPEAHKTEINISEADMLNAASMFPDWAHGKILIGYVVQAVGWNRTYPVWRVREIIRKLTAAIPGSVVVLIDPQVETAELLDGVSGALNLCGQTKTFMEAAAVAALCDIVITPDSGLAHVAGVLEKPCVVLCAGIPPDVRYKYYPKAIAIQATDIDCCPCWDWQERDTNKPGRRCKDKCKHTRVVECLEEIKPETIVKYTAVALGLEYIAPRAISVDASDISVVVTCHNNFNLTRECIDALQNGTVKPREIILIDNGSTDETQRRFELFPGIRYVRRNINDGSVIGRNIGMKLATGKRIFVLDNDQIVAPNTIEKYMADDCDLVGFELREVNELGMGRKLKQLTASNRAYLGIGGLLINRKIFEAIGYLDEGYAPAYCDDPDFFWRAVGRGFTWSWLPECGIDHRAHATLAHPDMEAYERSHARLRSIWWYRIDIEKPDAAEPLVSYVVPTFNRASFLPECIDSILAQTYKNIEIIVVDDGSNDGTAELIKTKYPNVKYLYHDNHRIPYTLNRGFKAARGEYVCWLSSDDGIMPDKTAKQVLFMQQHPELDLSFTEYEIRWRGDSAYTGNAGTIQHWTPKRFSSNYAEYQECFERVICNGNGSTTIFRTSAFPRMGYFIETLWTAQDWEMWLRYLRVGAVGMVNENLGYRNEHAGVSQGLCQKDPEMLKLFQAEIKFIKDYYRLFNEPNRPTICAMLLIKNEIEMIERCIDDLILWVDQIVIFDDGSTDGTEEIIKRYPKVTAIYTKPDIGNVRHESDDRQMLLEIAHGTGCEWLLFIDADEVFEDRMKSQVYEMINDDAVNLYHFHEINFWRCENKYRVDELFNLGWFGRLFRNLPGLRIMDKNEHCGGIPKNIPGATLFYSGQPAERKSDVNVKHWGFAKYDRTVDRACRRWARDPYRIEDGTPRGGWLYYDRMIDETRLELADYKECLI